MHMEAFYDMMNAQRKTHIEDHEVEEDEDDVQHHSNHQLQLADNCLGILQPNLSCQDSSSTTCHC